MNEIIKEITDCKTCKQHKDLCTCNKTTEEIFFNQIKNVSVTK